MPKMTLEPAHFLVARQARSLATNLAAQLKERFLVLLLVVPQALPLVTKKTKKVTNPRITPVSQRPLHAGASFFWNDFSQFPSYPHLDPNQSMKFFPLALASFLAFAMPSMAQDDPSSEVSVVTDAQTIAPNSTFTVALKLDHPEGWHSYYKNSGGVELPPSIKWDLPDGFEAGPIQWPTPQVKDGYFGKSFIYTGSPVFLVEISTPAELKAGDNVKLKMNAKWQICEELCLDEKAEFEISLPVGEEKEPNASNTELFESARAQLPTQSDSWTVSAYGHSDTVTIELSPSDSFGIAPTDFIPNQNYVKSVSSGGSITQDGDAIIINLPRTSEDAIGNEIAQGDTVSGILIGEKTSALIPTTTIGQAPANKKAAPAEAISFLSLLPILGGMFLGGLILNLMPCVFPVIGLKIMGFVQQAGEDKKKIILHGITFTLGVLASFGVLSGILYTARSAAGADKLGWGYQLQNPWVVLALILLMFILALNMFGIFEIGASATSVGGKLQSKQGLSGSFFSGVLATIVATPCSAPFLGAAIGTAIALPAIQFFSAFTAMAIGLSAPYLVLSIFPKLIDFLPRPGAWMESFKQGMSFLLFATAGYLLWVYAGQISLENLLGPIFGLSCIAIAAWIYGRWFLPHRKKNVRIAAIVLTLVFAATGFFLAKPPKESSLTWEKWSVEKVDETLADGSPVYIDFTAQWCATCQWNKKRAYNEDVIKQFEKHNVVTLKADKTKPNPAIDQALEKLGRSAIPVNVLLVPGKEPIILPELLSPSDVLEALETIE